MWALLVFFSKMGFSSRVFRDTETTELGIAWGYHLARRWEKHGKHVINKAEHLVSEYSAETFTFQEVWERDENLSVWTPHHSKNLGEPVCSLLSAPERFQIQKQWDDTP